MTFNFNEDATTYYNSNVTILAYTALNISNIKIKAISTLSTSSTATSSITVTITDGTSTVTSETLYIANGQTKNCNFDLNFISSKKNTGNTITISIKRTNANVFGGTVDNKTLYGCAASITSTSIYSCSINISSTQSWVMKETPELIDNIAMKWEDWQRDDNGYPYNQSVWKLDNQNDGYPWIVGFEPYTPITSAVSIKTTDGLVSALVFLKTESGLQAVNLVPK